MSPRSIMLRYFRRFRYVAATGAVVICLVLGFALVDALLVNRDPAWAVQTSTTLAWTGVNSFVICRRKPS